MFFQKDSYTYNSVNTCKILSVGFKHSLYNMFLRPIVVGSIFDLYLAYDLYQYLVSHQIIKTYISDRIKLTYNIKLNYVILVICYKINNSSSMTYDCMLFAIHYHLCDYSHYCKVTTNYFYFYFSLIVILMLLKRYLRVVIIVGNLQVIQLRQFSIHSQELIAKTL